jgi:alpha-L-fucosidase
MKKGKHFNFRFRLAVFTIVFLHMLITAEAQQNIHQQSTSYTWPEDPLVKAKLEQWRDQKFGMIIHWGLYAVPGIIESWSLCSEDWITRDSTSDYGEYKKWYNGLKNEFNPVKFNPEQWADAAAAAGMRYLVFTTKHHDGFSMFDTKQTDFKISAGPFANNPRADVAKYVFEAFRNKGMMIGAYFSKPDWHNENYWWPLYATADRNNNYDIRKFPWRWEKFKTFTHNQIGELMNNYGKVDILWLDGGWVRPLETVNDEVRSWGAAIPAWSQDIDMPAIAKMARKAQPGLLIVDRTVHGPYENYQTPEQRVPENKLDNPWESCITLGNAWGYVPNDQLKSSGKVIHQLIEVVAKGGSLLLGVGPAADGTLPEDVIKRLGEIGVWMKLNGAAIYSTRTTERFKDGNVYFTASKDGSTLYALALTDETKPLPSSIEWTGNVPSKGSRIKLLSGENVKYTVKGETVSVQITPLQQKKMPKTAAVVFTFQK